MNIALIALYALALPYGIPIVMWIRQTGMCPRRQR